MIDSNTIPWRTSLVGALLVLAFLGALPAFAGDPIEIDPNGLVTEGGCDGQQPSPCGEPHRCETPTFETVVAVISGWLEGVWIRISRLLTRC